MMPHSYLTSCAGRLTRGLMRLNFRRGLMIALSAASIGGCSNEILQPNYNSPTVDGLSKDPSGLQLAATGILVTERGNYFPYVRDVTIFGREGYYYFPTDNRFVTDYLIGSAGKLSSTGFASGNWFGFFRNMRNATNLVSAANSSGLGAAQKAAARGFANTMRGLDLYYAVSLRDTLGTPVEILANPNDQAPFVTRDSVYKRITAVLDSAKADLAAGGASFPFVLHSGFSGFDTPASFLKFNRAIAARVLAVRGSLECGNACYTSALTAVSESFASAAGGAASRADLDVGVYSIYSTSSGDGLNSLSQAGDANYLAHSSIVADAQAKPDGTPDARLTAKVAPLKSPRSSPGGPTKGITATEGFIIYPSNVSRTPIIRNEELLLIRAEANLKLSNAGAALIDLNNVRDISGGLAPIATPTVAALLYERRYSLLSEGFRWIDVRRFGLLSTLPLDLPNHFVAKVVPIPKAECDARLVLPVGC